MSTTKEEMQSATFADRLRASSGPGKSNDPELVTVTRELEANGSTLISPAVLESGLTADVNADGNKTGKVRIPLQQQGVSGVNAKPIIVQGDISKYDLGKFTEVVKYKLLLEDMVKAQTFLKEAQEKNKTNTINPNASKDVIKYSKALEKIGTNSNLSNAENITIAQQAYEERYNELKDFLKLTKFKAADANNKEILNALTNKKVSVAWKPKDGELPTTVAGNFVGPISAIRYTDENNKSGRVNFALSQVVLPSDVEFDDDKIKPDASTGTYTMLVPLGRSDSEDMRLNRGQTGNTVKDSDILRTHAVTANLGNLRIKLNENKEQILNSIKDEADKQIAIDRFKILEQNADPLAIGDLQTLYIKHNPHTN
jgi:hypothetical protein